MTLITAIKNARRKLARKAQRSGLYENFGQDEVRALEDKYIDISSYTDEMNKRRNLIREFDKWCMNFTL